MSRSYKIVMLGCGAAAVLGTALYILALSLVDPPLEVTGLALVGVSLLCIISAGCWIVRRGVREQFDENAAALADAVGDALAFRMEARIQRIATNTHAKTVSEIREAITGELMQETIDRAVGKARVYGMVAEARAKGAGSGDGKVAHLYRGGR